MAKKRKKYKKRTKPNKPGAGRPRTPSIVQFSVEREGQMALTALQIFYKCKTRQKLLEQMLVMCLIDTATQTPTEKWTAEQVMAHKYCTGEAQGMGRALLALAGRELEEEIDPKSKFTKREHSLLCKGKLFEKMEEAKK